MKKSDRFLRSRSFEEAGLTFSLFKQENESIRQKNPKPSEIQQSKPSDLLLKFIKTKPNSQPSKPFEFLSPAKSSFSTHSIFEHSPKLSMLPKLKKKTPKILSEQQLQTVKLFGVKNDFYAQLADSLTSSLAVFGLMDTAVLYDFKAERFLRPLDQEWEAQSLPVNSINCNPVFNNILGCGSTRGSISVIDVSQGKILKAWKSHQHRIGALKFHPSKPSLLASGSKDRKICVSDMRTKNTNQPALKLPHNGEICGLAWQSRGFALASGGNNNQVKVWDIRKPLTTIQTIHDHTAAIRAVEFSPLDSSLLASGGGAGDNVLRIGNIKRPKEKPLLIKTQSQICSLLWDPLCHRVLTSHGFSKYQLCLWDLEEQNLVAEYFGHKNRILDIVRLKKSKKILSFSADNEGKIWNCFKEPFKRKNNLFTPMKIR